MYRSLCFCLALISTIPTVSTQQPSDTNATWLYPDPATFPTYNAQDVLNASWISNFVDPWLHLYCANSSSSEAIQEPYNSSVAPTGSALIPLNYDTLEFICHFELSPTPEVGLGPPYVNSGNFEVMVNDSKKPMLWTNTSDSALTASASGSAGTSGRATVAPTQITNGPESIPTSSSSAVKVTASRGLSGGAIAGIAVGVTLASVALITVFALLLFRHRRHKRIITGDNTSVYWNFARSPEGQVEIAGDHVNAEKEGSPGTRAEKDGSSITRKQPQELEDPR